MLLHNAHDASMASLTVTVIQNHSLGTERNLEILRSISLI